MHLHRRPPVPEALALKIIGIWLDADFEGGRHERRVTRSKVNSFRSLLETCASCALI